jgi:alginate O-acetyltransferase complex protein AlgI
VIFNSLHYLIYLPLVTILYYVLPVRYRWGMLLAASFYFYMVWSPIYILLLVAITLIDYYCSIKMGNLPTKKQRKPYLIISLTANLGILAFFKYYNFFISSANDLLIYSGHEYLLPVLNVILPLGISFHTFQTMGYCIDVYKDKSPAEKHLGKFALYVTFFPQLIAGPIERAKHLLSQFHFNYKFEWNNITSGLRLIMMGMFKKVVIADQLSPMVSHAFNNPDSSHGITIYIACLLFIQQVYCDFSGYSDIARGSARMLGVDLMENFKLPFHAKSLTNFWGQWHISLMNWFRDYIMFPMVKNGWKWPVVFMLVFLISGVWHGANWTFIAWGLYNGIMVIYAKSTIKFRSSLLDKFGLKKFVNLRHAVQAFCVINIFGISSIFFRAQSLSDSWVMIKNLFNNFSPGLSELVNNANNIRQDVLYMGSDAVSFYIIILFMLALEIFQWGLRKKSIDELLNSFNVPVRFALYTCVILSIVLMSNIAETPFIYFQF